MVFCLGFAITFILYFETNNVFEKQMYSISFVEQYVPVGILVIGVILSILLAWLMYSYTLLGQKVRVRTQNLEDVNKAIQNVLEDLGTEKSKLEVAKAKDEALLASIGDGVIAVDEKLNVIFMNAAAEKLLGWKLSDVLGKELFEVVPVQNKAGELVTREKRPLSVAFTTGIATTTTTASSSYQYQYVRKDGSVFPAAITVTPVRVLGKTIGALEIFRDISKEKEIDKAKTEFVSLASHQLRTPLTAINWYVEMLQSGDVGKLNPNQKKYLEEIYKGSGRMVKLVNDLLNISRIETGKLKIEPEMIDTALFIADIIHEIEPWSTALHREIIFKTPKTPLPVIAIDKILMRQVIHNIITNAVRYSPESKNINVILESKNEDYIITIADQGIGIPVEVQGQIFEKFFRADNARAVESEGSGIGMYIAKSITEASGAKIWFESPTLFKKIKGKKVGYGTTFYLSIPISSM